MRTRLLGSLLVVTAIGCGGNETTSGRDLRQTTIPKDFMFQTTKGLSVKVSASDALFGDLADAQLVVAKPNGSTIFRGSIEKGQTVDVKVLAPAATQELKVTVSGRGGEAQKTFAVGNDGAVQGVVQ